MKKFFTLSIVLFTIICSKAQVVLNEFYPDPASGHQEYFELYNTSTSAVPESLDNYTLVSYYEEVGGKSGFYVLDMPAITVAAKGFITAASQIPFSIQGQSNLTANFSWNSLPAGGALTKWERSGSSYIQVAVPANLNDLFVPITSSGGVYHVFIYKNGLLTNGIIAGSNSNVIPNYIKNMPNLPVDMTGSSPDFTINFNAIADNNVEYLPANAGNDNGYFREFDGKCGVWLKSSTQVTLNPGFSNGSAADELGELTISATITDYVIDPTKSLLTYNITAGPASAFPVVIDTYSDVGVVGQLDASDILVDTRTISNTTSGAQNIVLPTATDPAILVLRSPAGCFDRVISVERAFSTLPVHMVSFRGNMDKNNKVTLNWTIADNETAYSFEIERSTNGRDFTTAGVVFASDKTGTENYMFYETINTGEKVMYRLKMIDKGHSGDYSKILVFQAKSSGSNNIRIIGNPVADKLTFSFTSFTNETVNLKVFDIAGRMMMNQKMNCLEGNNLVSLTLSSAFKPGMYVVEISNGLEIQTTKFLKK